MPDYMRLQPYPAMGSGKSGEFKEASARNGGGNPEPSPAKGMKVTGKVQRLGVSSPSNNPHQRPTSHWDDEIVHSLWKCRGRCNRLAAGSSPARGAYGAGRNSRSLFAKGEVYVHPV